MTNNPMSPETINALLDGANTAITETIRDELNRLRMRNLELVDVLKAINIWARNPSHDVLRDMKLIADEAEAALKQAGVL